MPWARCCPIPIEFRRKFPRRTALLDKTDISDEQEAVTDHHCAGLVEISHVATQSFIEIRSRNGIDRPDSVDPLKIAGGIPGIAAQLSKGFLPLLSEVKKWRFRI